MNAASTLSLARQQHKAGNLGPAETLCRQALAADPNNVDSLFLLGAVCHQLGRLDEAVSHYREAVRLKPDFAEAFTNLSHVLAAAGPAGRTDRLLSARSTAQLSCAAGEVPAYQSSPASDTAKCR